MAAIWLQIAWKEWREQVWKMIALGAIALSVQVYLLFNYPRDGWQFLMASLCLAPGALFIAMGVAAGERTAGNLEFVRSLPVALWKWAVIRLLAGAAAVLLPLLVLALLQLVAGGTRKVDEPPLGEQAAYAALLCLGIYLWAVAVGVDRSSELRAGVAAVCLFAGWLALVMAVQSLSMFFATSLRPVHAFLVAISPVGPSRLIGGMTPALWYVYLPQLFALGGTAWWSVHRYGRLSAGDDRSPAATARDGLAPTMLRPCRPSPLAAIAWKEYRETSPICLAGLALLAALMLPMLIGVARELGSRFFAVSTTGIASFGVIMAIVIGVGGPAGDLKPGVWQFWRSRPISASGWFWTKYLTGAAVLLVVFDGASTVIDLLGGGTALVVRDRSWWCGPVLHLFVYSASVWMVCQLRQPIYAGILSLAILISVVLLGDYPRTAPYLPWLSITEVIRTGPEPDTSVPDLLGWLTDRYVPFAAAMIALSLLFALLARLAVEWGTAAGGLGGRNPFRRARRRLAQADSIS